MVSPRNPHPNSKPSRSTKRGRNVSLLQGPSSRHSHVQKKKKHPTDTLSLFLQQQATSIRSIKSLVPLLDRVLVQRIKAEAKTASGIFLPESSVKELNEAKVLAVGPGGIDREGKRVPMGVQAGDRVLIPTVSLRWWRTRLSAREKKKYPPRG